MSDANLQNKICNSTLKAFAICLSLVLPLFFAFLLIWSLWQVARRMKPAHDS